MSFFDRLLGRLDPDREREPPSRPRPTPQGIEAAGDENERAVERYRYLLRTAPPETIEQAHAEAFARLTPEQRRMVLDELGRDLPPSERPRSDDPNELARAATRAEMREPGSLERSFARMPAMGGAGFFGGTFLSVMAGVFVGNALFDAFSGGEGDAADAGAEADAAAGDTGADAGGLGDAGGFGDFGGDFGGFGGE